MKHGILAVYLVSSILAFGQEKGMESCPAQHAGMNQRGDLAMGFSHEKTTHHFLLYADGGAIEVEANDAKDSASRDQIRGHLRHIAQMFSNGDFSAPMFIHGKTPPGVPVMEKRKAEISYKYEETGRGARVRIAVHDADALAAVHEFLRFQITDHGTGDTGSITSAESTRTE